MFHLLISIIEKGIKIDFVYNFVDKKPNFFLFMNIFSIILNYISNNIKYRKKNCVFIIYKYLLITFNIGFFYVEEKFSWKKKFSI